MLTIKYQISIMNQIFDKIFVGIVKIDTHMIVLLLKSALLVLINI